MSSEVLDKLVELITAALRAGGCPSVEHGYTGTLRCRLSRGRDLVAKFLYADVVTVIVVFVTIRLGWLAEQAKERERGPLGRLRE